MLQKGVRFELGEKQRKAVDDIKKALTEAPVLVHLDWSESLTLVTDASDTGMGAILMLSHGVVRYWSKTLSSSQRKWPAWERECLAIAQDVRHFSYLLSGTKTLVKTDSSRMTAESLNRHQDGNLSRWRITAQEFDLTFEHIPGKEQQICCRESKIS